MEFAAETTSPETGTWNVLVVDDDPQVHAVTEISLKNISIMGKKLSLTKAFSAAEAHEILQARNDFAVILLDVVMEEHTSGLDLVNRIRGELGNQMIRIVLRTGVPGDFPEAQVLSDYDINEYWLKTDLTYQRMKSIMYSSIRAYRDLLRLRGAQSSLKRMIYQLPNDFGELGVVEVGKQFFLTLNKLFKDLVDPADFRSGYLLRQEKGRFEVISSWNREIVAIKQPFAPEEISLIAKTFANLSPVNQNNQFLFPFRAWENSRWIIMIRWDLEPTEIQVDLTKVAAYQFSRWISNRLILDDLQKERDSLKESLDEKVVLLREVHHRVKNNLQMVSSLLSIGESDKSLDITDRFSQAQGRILSIALIHEHIYRSTNLKYLPTRQYIEDVYQEGVTHFSVGDKLALEVEPGEGNLTLDQAIPTGLVLLEFMAIRHRKRVSHAYQDALITLDYQGEHYQMEYTGPFHPDEESTKISQELIGMLSHQMNAEPQFEEGSIRILIPALA